MQRKRRRDCERERERERDTERETIYGKKAKKGKPSTSVRLVGFSFRFAVWKGTISSSSSSELLRTQTDLGTKEGVKSKDKSQVLIPVRDKYIQAFCSFKGPRFVVNSSPTTKSDTNLHLHYRFGSSWLHYIHGWKGFCWSPGVTSTPACYHALVNQTGTGH